MKNLGESMKIGRLWLLPHARYQVEVLLELENACLLPDLRTLF